jgi:hypothetical protein
VDKKYRWRIAVVPANGGPLLNTADANEESLVDSIGRHDCDLLCSLVLTPCAIAKTRSNHNDQ